MRTGRKFRPLCYLFDGILLVDDRELHAEVQELVYAGTTDPVEVQHLLKHRVHHYMCTGNFSNPTDRAYYPTADDIQKHISKAKRATTSSGCTAHIEITQLDIYPEYSVHSHMCTNISQKQARKIREESLKSLKQALKQSKGVEVTHKYYINLPTEEAHHK